MTTMRYALAAAALVVALAPTLALADGSVSGVESARAKERQGAYLSGQQRDALRRYGSNDDYRYYRSRYGYGYSPRYGGGYYYDSYYGGPGVSIYIGPGY